jgi:hypothetical protein
VLAKRATALAQSALFSIMSTVLSNTAVFLQGTEISVQSLPILPLLILPYEGMLGRALLSTSPFSIACV